MAPLAVTEKCGDQAVQRSFPSVSVSVPDWLATLASTQTTEPRPKQEKDQNQERARTDAELPTIDSFVGENKGQVPKASGPAPFDVNYPLETLFTDMRKKLKRRGDTKAAKSNAASMGESTLISYADVAAGHRISVQERQDEPTLSAMRQKPDFSANWGDCPDEPLSRERGDVGHEQRSRNASTREGL